jgi:hypothetical protein
MIALFDEPPRISIKSDAPVPSRNGLLLGFATGDVLFQGLVCLEDGSLTLLDSNFFTVDYRYSAETDRWSDVNQQKDEQD